MRTIDTTDEAILGMLESGDLGSANSKKGVLYNIPLKLSIIVLFFDILALLNAFLLGNIFFSLISGYQDIGTGSQIFSYYMVSGGLLLLNFYNKGHYRKRVPWWQQVKTIVQSAAFVLCVTVFICLVFEPQLSIAHAATTWLLAMTFIVICRLISFRILSKFSNWTVPVTLLGDNQMVIDCMYAFYNDGFTGIEVKNIMLRDKEKKPICLDFIPASHPALNVIDATGEYFDYIRQHKENFYIIGLEGIRGQNRDRLLKTLDSENISYAVVPPTKRLHLYGIEPQYFFGNDVMLLHQREPLKESVAKGMGRAFDIIVSCMLLPILGAMTLAVYVMKKREGSDTPMFYGGKRVGKDGKEFRCWKYCTMRKDADRSLKDLIDSDPAVKEEWDTFQKLKNDPRIDSKISQKLRSTSLDELPQLWNVFIGNMSLVGPRPILPDQRKDYGEYIALYESVRPGVTGLWQVSGRNETTFQQRVYWDSWYIKNWSLWHDIVILFKTVAVLTKQKNGAY